MKAWTMILVSLNNTLYHMNFDFPSNHLPDTMDGKGFDHPTFHKW